MLDSASSLSAGLGAAAARMVGLISDGDLLMALYEELQHLGISPEMIEKNYWIALEVFDALPRAKFHARSVSAADELASVGYDDPVLAAPSIVDAGNAEQRRTGSWRLERPIIDPNICTRCRLCLVLCPDGTMALDDDGYPVIDYDHCKGCMICRELCPVDGILKQKEVRAW